MSHSGKTGGPGQRVEREVRDLLTALEIDPENEEAKFLAKSALTGKADGSTLRAFITLTDRFKPDHVAPRPVIQVLMSDKASQEYIQRQIDQTHKPSTWMQDQSLPDDNWDNLVPNDNLELDNVVEIIKIPGTNGKGVD